MRAIVLTGAGEKAFVAGADINELAVQTPVAGQGARAPRPADLRRDRAARQAGDRGDQRLRARRRLRAGDGVHAAHRRRHRALRPARDQPRPHSRLCRQPAAAAPGRQGRGARDPADRRHDQRAARVRDRPGQPRRAGRGADGRSEEARARCSRRRRRSPCATSSKPCITASRCRSTHGQYLETTLFGIIASSDDMREGTRAFLEKRKAVWQGK